MNVFRILVSQPLWLIATAVLLLAGCGSELPSPEPAAEATALPTPQATAEPTTVTAMANPASVHCREQGGRLEIHQDAGGNELGVCLFDDGSQCEEWAFFRGECQPGQAGPTIESPAAGPTAEAPAATATAAPAAPQSGSTQAEPSADELAASVLATLPAAAFDGVAVKALDVPAGSPRLWAVYSHGARNRELDPLPSHFVALFTYGPTGWEELARYELDAPRPGQDFGGGPDFVGEDWAGQVQLAPGRIWWQVQGGVGAHSGTYQLLSFDGAELRLEVAGAAASPGFGRLADLNRDGVPEVVLDVSDRYVLCYACGVSNPQFRVYTWDAASQVMQEVSIRPMLMGQQGHPAREPNNRAVTLAAAGLWRDALGKITEAREAANAADEPTDEWTLDWNEVLIQLYNDAHSRAIESSAYPLLNLVFAGDYAAAVDLMRPYSVDEIFNPDTPLLKGTAAQGWEYEASDHILTYASAAIGVQPDLAPAYFLRAWAEFLADPPSPQVQADLARAAELAPDDPLFAAAAGLHPAPDPTAVVMDHKVSYLEFEPGASSAMAGGGLVAHGAHRYFLRALAGQTMQVKVASPGDVVVTVEGEDGTVLADLSQALTEWRGQLPANQEYVVTVVSIGTGTSFTLTVSIEPPDR